MRDARVIPILLLHNGGLYKTIKFKEARYIGDPINTIRIFNDLEVDEIIFLDIDASKFGRGPNFELIEELVSEAFMPVSYGGGIRELADAERIFRCGVEKIIINRRFIEKPEFIKECAVQFGSQSIVVSFDYMIDRNGLRLHFDHVVNRAVESLVMGVVKLAEDLGAGEVFLNCVDNDGVMSGVDVRFIEEVAGNIGIQIIACGGVGNLNHILEAYRAGANGIAAGSFFVYRGRKNGVLISYPSQKILDNLFK